ncbi:MAG: ATPase [Deltaproteobacteria bacterium]|nr:ATPase [Deltaproteobacteria bacterium]
MNFFLKQFRKAHPATLLLLSYLVAIGLGTCLLLMPQATVSGSISFIDALFTATSALCVTGLVVADTGTYFSLFGQGIILVLIQLGGLGIMTFSVFFFLSIGKKVAFRQRMVMQETFAHMPREDIYRLVSAIFSFTAVAELVGALLLFIHWTGEYPLSQAAYMAIFHSVSAFCNAGFALFSNSFMDYRGALLLNFTVCGLIILGGIGFPVIYEIFSKTGARLEGHVKFSVQTKTVLLTTCILIIFGMAILGVAEHSVSLRDCSFAESLLAALFQSVTARTAGFNTVHMAALSNATLGLMIFLMFIGASPGSCGGGVKTTTFAVLGALTWSRLRRRIRVNMFKKSIPRETVSRSISLYVLAVGFTGTILALLLLTQQGAATPAASRGQFLEYLFEVVSAFGTVGLSMGATAKINSCGKILIIVMMLIGRVGVLTFSYIIAGAEAKNGIEYAEENIMIG